MSEFVEITTANYSNQRVGLFVDVQNLYYSARALFKARVNFDEIMRQGVRNRNLIRAISYVVKADVADENSFFEALEKIGFDIKAKDLQVFYGGQKKGDWDVGIAMDIMRLASKLDVIVLCSGDGDFTDLLRHAKSLGCKTEVMSFKKSASSLLVEEADRFVDLGADDRYIIASKRAKATARKTSPKKRTSSRSTNVRRGSGKK